MKDSPVATWGWGRWAWRRLTSMQTALMLLLLLAVAAIPGSLFPQRRIDAGAVSMYLSEHPRSGPWLDRGGFFDVYAASWFAAVYLLLFVSLVGCVFPRAMRHWRAMWADPPRPPRNLERMPVYVVGHVQGQPDSLLTSAAGHLRRRLYRVVGDASKTTLSAERGYTAETANLAFHLALLGILVSFAVGTLYGWGGQVLLVEGATFANTPAGYDAFRPGARTDARNLPPFLLTLDDLRVRFEKQAGSDFGAPRQFLASISVRDTPSSLRVKVPVEVNKPLSVGGARVFLVGNGYAPVITVRDGRGKTAFSGAVPFVPRDGKYTSTGVVKVPDAQPQQLGLTGLLLPTAVFDPKRGPISVFPDAQRPRLVLTAFVGDLGLSAGMPQSVYTLDTARMRQLSDAAGPVQLLLAPGGSATLPDNAGSVTFDGLRRFAALDVRADPSKLWMLIAAVLALLGLTGSLFIRRRRIWIRAIPDGTQGIRVEVAALARSHDHRLVTDVAALAQVLGLTWGQQSSDRALTPQVVPAETLESRERTSVAVPGDPSHRTFME